MDGLGSHCEQLKRLGPHRAAVGCLYVKRLADIDVDVLESMVAECYHTLTAGTYGHRAREPHQQPVEETRTPGASSDR